MSARELEKEGETAVAKALSKAGEGAVAGSGEVAVVRTMRKLARWRLLRNWSCRW
jgi:hypothetical protein